MNVLVTGGAGYLGSVLVPRLLEAGHRVRVLDSLLFGGEGLLGVCSHSRFELIRDDVREVKAVAAALAEVEAVIHLAALVGDAQCNGHPEEAWAVNFEATQSLIEEARAASIPRVLLASTCSCYGISDPKQLADEDSPLNAVSIYGETKVSAEASGVELSGKGSVVGVLRLATLFGLSPRMRFDLLLNEFARDALLQKRLAIYGPDSWRPFLHVQDAADVFLRCLEVSSEMLDGEVYNVGCGNYRKREIGAMLLRHVPDLKLEFTEGKDDPRDYRVAFGKAERLLGFQPQRDVEEGLLEIRTAIEAGIITDPTDERYGNTPAKARTP